MTTKDRALADLDVLRARLADAMSQSEVAAALGIPAATFRGRRHDGDPLIEPPIFDARGPVWLPEQVERMRAAVTARPAGNPAFAKRAGGGAGSA